MERPKRHEKARGKSFRAHGDRRNDGAGSDRVDPSKTGILPNPDKASAATTRPDDGIQKRTGTILGTAGLAVTVVATSAQLAAGSARSVGISGCLLGMAAIAGLFWARRARHRPAKIILVLAIVIGIATSAGAVFWAVTAAKSPIAITWEINPLFNTSSASRREPPMFVIPGPASDLGEAPQCGSRFRAYALAAGGTSARATDVRITLQGKTNSAVAVYPKVTVHARHPPGQGTYVSCQRVGGDFVVPRDVRVNLDAPQPELHYFVAAQEVASPFVLSLDRGETEVIDLHVTARSALYDWTAEISVVVDGNRHTTVIDDDGHPFRTTSVVSGSTTFYEWNNSGWTPARLSLTN